MARDYVTIVSGLPRSGTSMMMRMLGEGGMPLLIDNLRSADIDNPNGYYEFEPVKTTKEDPSWLADGVGKVVKMVHLLLLDLPLEYQYRVILMRRDMREVIRSQNRMLERKGRPVNDLPDERITQLYRGQLEKVTSHLESHHPTFRYLEVDYNAIVADPRPTAQRISDMLDGLDVPRMAASVDARLYRNRGQAPASPAFSGRKP
jgi:hypothetical protein